MILDVACDDHRVTIEVTADAGVRKVTVAGREVPHDWMRLPNDHYSLIIDGRVYDFLISFTGGKCSVVGRDGARMLSVSDGRNLASQRAVEEGQSGLQRLTADMPGKVIRVMVGAGDTVAYEQGLLVLEAMKMQNEIRAPKSGTVREIGVGPGMTVSTGDFLLSLE